MQLVSTKISTIVHATEDLDKVKNAINELFSQTNPESRIEKKVAKGHFGNEIITLTIGLASRPAETFLENLWKSLSSIDRETLISELDARLDEEGKLHLRLDKQECYRQTIRLRDQDPIKVQLSFGAFSNHVSEVRRLLESLQYQTS